METNKKYQKKKKKDVLECEHRYGRILKMDKANPGWKIGFDGARIIILISF